MTESDDRATVVRVVVVDDHPIVRAGIVSVLHGSHACRVVGEADNAASALELLVRLAPHVVVLDLKLPPASGLNLVGELACLAPGTEVLVLTAYEEVGLARQALSQGARGYLLKGIPGEGLVSAIRRVAAGQRVIDPALAGQLWDLEMGPGTPTRREIEVLRLVAAGRTNKQVAAALGISQDTVKYHVKNLFRRLDARSRAEVVAAATWQGYLQLQEGTVSDRELEIDAVR